MVAPDLGYWGNEGWGQECGRMQTLHLCVDAGQYFLDLTGSGTTLGGGSNKPSRLLSSTARSIRGS
jgi:hypothetical protein